MPITDHQYQRLMNEMNQGDGVIGHAAMKSGMDRKTARRYLRAGQGPADLNKPHTWRTREDPVKAIWDEAERQLHNNPGLEAQELFEELLRKWPGAVDPRALRTFRRRVAHWRRKHGPDIEVFFPQIREPGESMQLDWTDANQLGVTIGGKPYPHKLCHSILPYSNAEWAVPCQSESTSSLIVGSQDAYREFGGVTARLQTDQSSTATHQLSKDSKERVYNELYLALCDHLTVKPRTTAVDCPDQNGDIESMNGHLKRRLEQKLLLRGSRDFRSQEDYAAFVVTLCRELNRRRGAKVIEELKCLRPLPSGRFPDTVDVTARVSCFATVRVKKLPFSVPARLIGAIVQALVSEKTVRILYEGKEVARHPRIPGKGRVHYRHVIKWLVRKPGAFAAYQFREDLFPQPVYRQAHERLKAADEGRADRNYLLVLELAHDRGEDAVADALGGLLREGLVPSADAVKDRLAKPAPSLAAITPFVPSMRSYDALLKEVAS
jgi:transposase